MSARPQAEPGGVPPGLLVLAGLVAVAAVVLAAALVPWTPAPVVADPTGGLPVDDVARADAVAAALRLPSLLSQAAGLLAAALVVLTRPGRRLLGRADRLRGGTVVRVAAQVLLVLLVVLVVRWPFGVWAETVRRTEGLSVRGWDVFARDRLLAAGLDALVTAAAVVAVVLLARRLPRWWPAAAAGAGAVLVVVASLLYPVLVEPLFARFEPLPAGAVRTPGRAGRRGRRCARARRAGGRHLDPGHHPQRPRLGAGPHPAGGAAGHAARGHDTPAGPRRRRARDRARRLPRRRPRDRARGGRGRRGGPAAGLRRHRGRDPAGRDPTGRDPTGRDPTARDPAGRDPTGPGPRGPGPRGPGPAGAAARRWARRGRRARSCSCSCSPRCSPSRRSRWSAVRSSARPTCARWSSPTTRRRSPRPCRCSR